MKMAARVFMFCQSHILHQTAPRARSSLYLARTGLTLPAMQRPGEFDLRFFAAALLPCGRARFLAANRDKKAGLVPRMQ